MVSLLLTMEGGGIFNVAQLRGLNQKSTIDIKWKTLSKKDPCPLVHTDIWPLQWGSTPWTPPSCRCRLRVVDTFGTEPAYNHEEYATLHGYRTNWGYWNLHPKQFMTMFREFGNRDMGGELNPSKHATWQTCFSVCWFAQIAWCLHYWFALFRFYMYMFCIKHVSKLIYPQLCDRQ